MKLLVLLLLYSFLIGVLFRSEGNADEYLNQSIKYKACLELAKKNPIKGYASATKWFSLDKGIAARHCMAVSIFYSGDNLNGASRLEILERDIPKKQLNLRSQILAQASQLVELELGCSWERSAEIYQPVEWLKSSGDVVVIT